MYIFVLIAINGNTKKIKEVKDMKYVVEAANYFSEGYCYGGCGRNCSSLEDCGINGCGDQTLPA